MESILINDKCSKPKQNLTKNGFTMQLKVATINVYAGFDALEIFIENEGRNSMIWYGDIFIRKINEDLNGENFNYKYE